MRYICNILLTTDNIFTIHVPKLINVELSLFMQSQFTTNVPDILHLNLFAHGRVCSWTVANSKGPEVFENDLTHINDALVKCFCIVKWS
jgi:hypothetical protein